MTEYVTLTDLKFSNYLKYKTSRYQTSPRVRADLLSETRAFPEPQQVRDWFTPVEEYEIWQELANPEDDQPTEAEMRAEIRQRRNARLTEEQTHKALAILERKTA